LLTVSSQWSPKLAHCDPSGVFPFTEVNPSCGLRPLRLNLYTSLKYSRRHQFPAIHSSPSAQSYLNSRRTTSKSATLQHPKHPEVQQPQNME
jgi:hypothetical protein